MQSLARELAAKSNDSLRAFWKTYWKNRRIVYQLPPRIDSVPYPSEGEEDPRLEELMYKSVIADTMCLVTNDSLRGSNAELDFNLRQALQNPVCTETFMDRVKRTATDVGICGACFGIGYGIGKILP